MGCGVAGARGAAHNTANSNIQRKQEGIQVDWEKRIFVFFLNISGSADSFIGGVGGYIAGSSEAKIFSLLSWATAGTTKPIANLQGGGDRTSVGFNDRCLQFTCIIAVSRIG